MLGTSLGAALMVRERHVTDPSDIEFRSEMTVELVKANASDADVLFAARVSTKGEQSLEDVDAIRAVPGPAQLPDASPARITL